MKKLFKFSLFILLFTLFTSSTTFAAAAPAKPSTLPQAVVLATVNIKNAKIISQKENVFNISFSLTNREGLQTGVKYGVKLIKDNKFMADEKIYDESFTLNPNSEIKKEIVYTAPSTLSGVYSILLESNNTNGFPFALVSLGNVTLKSGATGLQILPETCYLQVEGEKNSPKYNLVQGVDIKNEENLKLTCTVLNSSNAEIKANPKYETRYRSTYGDIVEQTGGSLSEVTVTKGEKKSISFILPKATKPQSYNVDVSLVNSSDKSNSVSVHYVLRGVSASIQNVSLDKDYYAKGEQAKVSFIYTPSADSFDGSRLGKTDLTSVVSTFKMMNGKGKSCAKTQTKDLMKQMTVNVEFPLAISKSCFDPKIMITLTGDKGMVLDHKEFNVKTTSVSEPKSNTVIYIIIAIILLLILSILTYLKKKKTLPTSTPISTSVPVEQVNKTENNIPVAMLFFFLLLSIASFIPKGEVSADTVSVGNRYVIVDINKGRDGVYNKNETLIASGSIIAPTCLNFAAAGKITANIAGAIVIAEDIRNDGVSNIIRGWEGEEWVGDRSAVPSIGGNYNVDFDITVYGGVLKTTIPDSYIPCEEAAPNYCNKYFDEYWCHFEDGSETGVYTRCSDDTSQKYTFVPSHDEFTDTYLHGTYSIPYSVVTATVQAKLYDGYTSPINYDGKTRIQWWPENADSCSCTYYKDAGHQNEPCGTGSVNKQWNYSPLIENLTKTTTFKVHCD